MIGKINIYDIYDVCLDSHLGPTIESQQRAKSVHYGPFGCINDTVESTYFNDSAVS